MNNFFYQRGGSKYHNQLIKNKPVGLSVALVGFLLVFLFNFSFTSALPNDANNRIDFSYTSPTINNVTNVTNIYQNITQNITNNITDTTWIHNLTTHVIYPSDSLDKVCIGTAAQCINPSHLFLVNGGANITGNIILDNVALVDSIAKNMFFGNGTQNITLDSLTGNIIGTGRIRAGFGSASSPAFSFTGATSTGFYAISATDVRYALSGTDFYRLTSGSNAQMQLGNLTSLAWSASTVGNSPDIEIRRVGVGIAAIADGSVSHNLADLQIKNMTATNISATNFIKSGGTSVQFLMADGSVDRSRYLNVTTGQINQMFQTSVPIGNQFLDSVWNNKLMGRGEVINFTLDNVRYNDATAETFVDQNYDGGGALLGLSGGVSKVFAIQNMTASGLTDANGFIYPNGYFVLAFYTGRGVNNVTYRTQDKNGVWTNWLQAVVYTNTSNWEQWRATVTTPNYIIAAEFNITGSAVANSGHLTEIEYEGTRMTLAEGGLFTKAGGNIYGNINIGAGTVSLPAFSFFNDTNTGLYWIGADRLGVTIGGTKVSEFNSTGLFLNNNLSVGGFGEFASYVQTGTYYKISTDTFIQRTGPGNVKITNGGTSLGDLLIGNINATGNISGSLYYGEVWMHNDTGVSFNVAASNTYYPLNNSIITNYSVMNGFTFNPTTGKLQAQIGGLYQIQWHGSGSGAANHNYHMGVALNDVAQGNMEQHLRLSSLNDVGSMSDGSFIRMNVGDNLTIVVEDTTGTGTATLYSAGMTALRIGN